MQFHGASNNALHHRLYIQVITRWKSQGLVFVEIKNSPRSKTECRRRLHQWVETQADTHPLDACGGTHESSNGMYCSSSLKSSYERWNDEINTLLMSMQRFQKTFLSLNISETDSSLLQQTGSRPPKEATNRGQATMEFESKAHPLCFQITLGILLRQWDDEPMSHNRPSSFQPGTRWLCWRQPHA